MKKYYYTSLKPKPVIPKTLVLLIVGLLVFVSAIFGFALFISSSNNWSEDIQMKWLFATVAILIEFVSAWPVMDYCKMRAPNLIKENNNLFFKLDNLSKNGLIDEFQFAYRRKNRLAFLNEINLIIIGIDSNRPYLTEANVESFFDNQSKDNIYSLDMRWTVFTKLLVLHKRYCQYFDGAQRILRDYKNLSIISKPKFPILEIVLPLAISLISFFFGVLQFISPKEDWVNNAWAYLMVFFLIALFPVVFTFLSSKSISDAEAAKINETIKDIDAYFGDRQI